MLHCSQNLFVSFQGHASRYIYGPDHEILVLIAPPPPKEMSMKVKAKLYGPVYDTFVLIACASSEGLDELAHLRSVTTAFAARTEKREGM